MERGVAKHAKHAKHAERHVHHHGEWDRPALVEGREAEEDEDQRGAVERDGF